MGIKKEDVLKALDELDVESDESVDSVNKATEQGLEQAEGSDLGWPADAKKPMSDEAKAGNGKDKKMKKKSFAEELPEEVETKIEVSDFLKSLVNHTGESVDQLREAVEKSVEAGESRYDDLTDNVADLQKSQAKIGIVLKAICEKIGVIENQPAHAPKAETFVKSEGAAERKFESADSEEASEKVFKSLSDNPLVAKSQVTNAMCELVKSGEADDMDVIGFESGGYIKPELVAKLKEKLN